VKVQREPNTAHRMYTEERMTQTVIAQSACRVAALEQQARARTYIFQSSLHRYKPSYATYCRCALQVLPYIPADTAQKYSCRGRKEEETGTGVEDNWPSHTVSSAGAL